MPPVGEHQGHCQNVPGVFGTGGVSPGAAAAGELQTAPVSSSGVAPRLLCLGSKFLELTASWQSMKMSCWSFSS